MNLQVDISRSLINAVCSSETLVYPTSAHGIATQKTNIKIVLYVNNCKYGDDAKVRYVTSHNFNVIGIFTNKNYSQKWMTNLCNYEFIVTYRPKYLKGSIL